MIKRNPYHDPKGLMRDAYRIEGIVLSECRSIFLDWALSIPLGLDSHDQIKLVLAEYGASRADHPMTVVLKEGLGAKPALKRRGGRKARLQQD